LFATALSLRDPWGSRLEFVEPPPTSGKRGGSARDLRKWDVFFVPQSARSASGNTTYDGRPFPVPLRDGIRGLVNTVLYRQLLQRIPQLSCRCRI